MNKFFGKKDGATASKQTGLFGQAPKQQPEVDMVQEDADMDIDEAMLKKVNEMPKFVPWVEK